MNDEINMELSNLVRFAYLLYEKKLDYVYFPTYKEGGLSKIDYGAKLPIGGMFGKQQYDDHSTYIRTTTVGVFEGKKSLITKKYKIKNAFLMTSYGKYFSINPIKLDEKGIDFIDDKSGNSKISEEDIITAFSLLGFLKDDVKAVLKGTMSAEEAYTHIVPDEIKYRRTVDYFRRHFVFEGNVAVEGQFGGIWTDYFPFSFNGQPILDCSKVDSAIIQFGENKRRVKLINVNKNPNSIRNTDLRAAIIEEPVDLSLVDAYGTTFGHHVVINANNSIAPLNCVNLALAVNELGEKYVTDEEGHIISQDTPKTKVVDLKRDTKIVRTYANVDNMEMALLAVENNADGIGLIRTENVFRYCSKEDLKNFMMNYKENNPIAMEIISRLTKEQLESILAQIKDSPVTIRLLDFNFKEFLQASGLSLDDVGIEKCPETRGITKHIVSILDEQIKVIANVYQKYGTPIRVLLPLVDKFEENYNVNSVRNVINYIRCLFEKFGMPNIKVGVMVENLLSTNYADEIAKYADFISIGTNDLTESVTGLSRYTQAPEFTTLSDNVKKAIEDAIYKARAIKQDIEIGICGEHGNYVENLEYYAGLNIDYVTCGSAYVRLAKEILNNGQNRGGTLSRKK